MDLFDAAMFFTNDPVADGYTGQYLFDAQAVDFNAAKSDSATFRRRTMVVSPDTVLPARQVLTLYGGGRWLAGTGTPDGFWGEEIRTSYSLKHVTDSLAALTPAQALAGAAGTQMWVHKLYMKDINTPSDSDYDPLWDIFIAPNEPVAKGTLLRDANGMLFRARETYMSIEGLRVASTDELGVGIQTAQFAGGTFDPVMDSFSGGTTSVPAIQVDIAKLFKVRERSDGTILAGDIGVLVPINVTQAGGRFTLAGRQWVVRTIQPHLDAMLIHARGAT